MRRIRGPLDMGRILSTPASPHFWFERRGRLLKGTAMDGLGNIIIQDKESDFG
jgi:hypothetical protein